jgi:hypothetical protein
MITSGVGLFYKTDDRAFDFINQYGHTVKLYGNGLYKNDSYLMAPIFKGTDFTDFFIAVPVLFIALLIDIKKNTIKTNIFLLSIVSIFLYYSASISLGVVYNILHLVYISLFSISFFAFIIGFTLLKSYNNISSIRMNTIGLKVFLAVCGISLFVAWLPDIIVSLINKTSLELIEVYTTQKTNVFDMAIISPLMFICIFHLSKNDNQGYILLGIILNMLIFVGLMVINQTIFQSIAGIELPNAAIITKVGIFVLLAIFALYYNIKLFEICQIKCNKDIICDQN